MEYLIGRENLAATIYVPYDCGNNCPFCTSKAMYRNLEPNLDLLWKNLILINKTTGIKDVVLTGGEPFANLEILQKILDKISISKNVFINTTLPFGEIRKQIEILKFLSKNRTKISCLNISRHITYTTRNDDNDDFINHLPVPFRINCVLYNNTEITKEKAINFIKRWPNARNINFRADYRFIDFTNLKTVDHPFIQFLVNELNAKYLGGGGCQVCNTDNFVIDDEDENRDDLRYKLSFHRGMEHSSLQVGNTVIINDIIMMPDSHMYYDWDKKRPTEPDKKMLDVLRDLGYHYSNTFGTPEQIERSRYTRSSYETSTRRSYSRSGRVCGVYSFGGCGGN